MPTTKKRISVTVSDEAYICLKAYSEETGESLSSFLQDLLNMSLPIVKEVTRVSKVVKKLKKNPRLQLLDHFHNLSLQVLHQADATEKTVNAILQKRIEQERAERNTSERAKERKKTPVH